MKSVFHNHHKSLFKQLTVTKLMPRIDLFVYPKKTMPFFRSSFWSKYSLIPSFSLSSILKLQRTATSTVKQNFLCLLITMKSGLIVQFVLSHSILLSHIKSNSLTSLTASGICSYKFSLFPVHIFRKIIINSVLCWF